LQSATTAYAGKLREARDLSRQLLALAPRSGGNHAEALYETEIALREALYGEAAEARKHATAAVRDSTGKEVEYAAALAFAFAGATTEARALSQDLAKRFPQDTAVQLIFLPTNLGQISGNRKDALETLQTAAPYELADCVPASVPLDLYPVFVRGGVYLAAQQGSEAAAEFAKIIDHRSLVLASPIGALAYLGLARARVLQRDTASARTAYEHFLTLWKDADSDIPVLKKAKYEYQKIK
jgi:tetratricopeptide (TPR) repeat protein